MASPARGSLTPSPTTACLCATAPWVTPRWSAPSWSTPVASTPTWWRPWLACESFPLWGQLLNRKGWYMDSRLRGNDGRRREGRINYLVVLADAGTHTSWQGWIPAFAVMTNRAFARMTELRRKDGNLPLWAGMNSVSISHVWCNTFRVMEGLFNYVEKNNRKACSL